jgi:hypothetical protein
MNSFPEHQVVHFKTAMHDDLILVSAMGKPRVSPFQQIRNAARVAQAKTGRQRIVRRIYPSDDSCAVAA